MKKYGQCVFFAVLFLAFLGCDIGFSNPSDLPSTSNPPSTNPPSANSPQTINWELGTDGFYRFYTNESRNYSRGFPYLSNNPNQNNYGIEIKKVSGARSVPYGMIFGYADNNNYYFVYITVDGYYLIGYYVYGNLYESDVFYSSSLRTGFNVSNTIRVTKSGSTFQVSFNGSYAGSFDANSSITGSRFGPIAIVGSSGDESFPNNPVDVRFR